MNIVQRIEWRLYKERKKRKLKNLTPTIIASNCNGEFIYYDMNLKFRSPTINLSFEMNDYVKMLENLEWYMKQPILPYEDERFEYPTGMLGDIEIRFNHYETLEEAIGIIYGGAVGGDHVGWLRRRQRWRRFRLSRYSRRNTNQQPAQRRGSIV